MARKMTEWPSKRGPITKIMPSDGCIGDTVPLAVGKWYDFHEFGWYMGNAGFFKWIKQHLRIKQFYGTSENAVKTQIWIAVSVYVLVAIVKKRLDLDASLYTLLQILSVTLFEKMPIHQALAGDENRCNASQITNQLNLFDF